MTVVAPATLLVADEPAQALQARHRHRWLVQAAVVFAIAVGLPAYLTRLAAGSRGGG